MLVPEFRIAEPNQGSLSQAAQAYISQTYGKKCRFNFKLRSPQLGVRLTQFWRG